MFTSLNDNYIYLLFNIWKIQCRNRFVVSLSPDGETGILNSGDEQKINGHFLFENHSNDRECKVYDCLLVIIACLDKKLGKGAENVSIAEIVEVILVIIVIDY